MILIDDHTVANLDVIAQTHYNGLIGIPLADGVNYHATGSLIQRIRNKRDHDLRLGHLTRVNFWNYLLENNFLNLQRLITGRPPVLKAIIEEIEDITGSGFFCNDVDYNNASLTEFGEEVKTVFNYSNYRAKDECRNTYNQLGLSLCPYCNEQVTQVIENLHPLSGERRRQALLQLDHFYPQVRHPYLAVSFFNMIPGCSICNAQLKLEKKFDIDSHFNPFHRRLDDYFAFELNGLHCISEDDVMLSYRNKSAYPDNSLKDFNIMERYKNQVHRRAIYKLFVSLKNHSPKINRSISRQIINLFIAGESQRKILLSNGNIPENQKEIGQVFLGKVKRDVAIQMGVL